LKTDNISTQTTSSLDDFSLIKQAQEILEEYENNPEILELIELVEDIYED